MLDVSDRVPRGQTLRGFATGVMASGAALFLSSVSPVLALAAIALGVVASLVGAVVAPAARARRFATAAGFLTGSGSLFLLVAASAISACSRTADFCGDANLTPLFAAGVASAIAGLVVGAGAIVADRRSRSQA